MCVAGDGDLLYGAGSWASGQSCLRENCAAIFLILLEYVKSGMSQIVHLKARSRWELMRKSLQLRHLLTYIYWPPPLLHVLVSGRSDFVDLVWPGRSSQLTIVTVHIYLWEMPFESSTPLYSEILVVVVTVGTEHDVFIISTRQPQLRPHQCSLGIYLLFVFFETLPTGVNVTRISLFINPVIQNSKKYIAEICSFLTKKSLNAKVYIWAPTTVVHFLIAQFHSPLPLNLNYIIN